MVCATLRLDLNIDYDRLAELVNHHSTIREMLGHGSFEDNLYTHQTLKDNLSQLIPALRDKVNQLIIKAGHRLVNSINGKKPARSVPRLRERCDSFAVKTSAHFPTDICLLCDAVRKVIGLTARWCKANNLASCSFDKGFYSHANQTALNELLDLAACRTMHQTSISQRVQILLQTQRNNHYFMR